MRKIRFAVIITLILTAVSLLAVSVLADSGNSSVWTPEEGSGIFYGVWADEESYLAGDAPIDTNLTDGIDDESSGSNVLRFSFLQKYTGKAYVRAYSNFYLAFKAPGASTSSNKLLAGQDIIFDLGGNTMTVNSTYGNLYLGVYNTVTKASVEFRNGVMDTGSFQTQYQPGVKITFRNLHYKGNQFGYDAGPDLIRFVDSTVELAHQMPFYLGSHDTKIDKAELLFENTDIILTSKDILTDPAVTSKAKNAIFYFYSRLGAGSNWQIVLDSESSISCPNLTAAPVWLAVAEAGKTMTGVPTVYYEKGFTFNGNTLPNFVYMSSSLTSGGFVDNKKAGALNCRIVVVDPGSREPAESYTLMLNPDGSYTYATPNWAYAFYKSETDYFAGNQPMYTSDDPIITPEIINSTDAGYLQLYKNTTLDATAASALLGAGRDLTVMLNNLTLTVVGGEISVANDADGSKLTVSTGSLVTESVFSIGGGNSLTLDSVNYSGTSIGGGRGFLSFDIVSSDVTLSADMPFFFTASDAAFNVSSSVLNVTSSAIASNPETTQHLSNNAIITVKYTTAASLDIRFDKTATLNTSSANPIWLSVIEEASTASVVNMYYECGFRFTSAASPNFKYTYLAYGEENYLLSDENSAVSVVIRVVEPGTKSEAVGWELSAVGGGLSTFDSVVWAAYTSEEAFLRGDDPIGSNLTDEMPDELADKNVLRMTYVKTLGNCYVRLFDDVIISSYYYNDTARQAYLAKNQEVVIDFAGYTVSTNTAYGIFILGAYSTLTPCTLTFKNGTFITKEQFQFCYGTTLKVENVDFKSGALGYDSGGSIEFYNSTVTISSSDPFYLGHNFGAHLWFTNTDLILSAATVNATRGIFRITSALANTDTHWDIRFDADSSITAPAITGPWVSVADVRDTAAITSKSTLYIEEGFTFNSSAFPSLYYNCIEADELGNIPSSFTAREFDGKFEIKFVKRGEYDSYEGELFAVPTEGGKYALATDVPEEGVAWYTSSASSLLNYCAPSVYVDGISYPVLTYSDMLGFEEGCEVVFVDDVWVYVTASEKYLMNFANDLTLDLGGNNFYCNVRIIPELKVNSVWRDAILTMKNGKIISEMNDNLFFGNLGGGVITLSDIEIEHTATTVSTSLIYIYAGSFVMENTTVSTPCDVLSADVAAGDYPLISFDGVTINTPRTIINCRVNSNSKYTYRITNSTLNAGVYALKLNLGTNASAANYLNIDISDSYITGELLTVASGLTAPVTVTLSDTYLAKAPTTLSAPHSVVCGTGERLLSVVHDTYAYHVGKFNETIKSNLVLDSDFTVKFFLPKDTVITKIVIGDREYNVSELSDTVDIFPLGAYYVFEFAYLSPANAAELIEYEVYYVSEDIHHTAYLTYSALDYIAALLDSDFSYLIKELAVSCTEYIYAAYSYMGYTNAELDALMSSALYRESLPELVRSVGGGADSSALGSVIASAQLNLGTTAKFRINLKEGFTTEVGAPLIVGDVSYEVVNGLVAGKSYIEIELHAHELYDTVIPVSVGSVSGTVTLADYAFRVESSANARELQLVRAFYSYCYYADRYYNASVAN